MHWLSHLSRTLLVYPRRMKTEVNLQRWSTNSRSRSYLTIIELTMWLAMCVWQLTPRTAGYVRIRILTNRWFFRIFGIHSLYVSATFYTPGAYALTRSQAVQRSRAVHAYGALRLVGGCTRRHKNVGGVTAGQAPHNSSNVGVCHCGPGGTQLRVNDDLTVAAFFSDTEIAFRAS